jgi:hypothetical protein
MGSHTRDGDALNTIELQTIVFTISGGRIGAVYGRK